MSLVQDFVRERHEKNSDEFVSFWARFLIWSSTQAKLLLSIAGAILVVGLIWYVGSYYWQGQQTKAAEQFYLVNKENDETKRMQALQDFIAQYESQPAAKFALFELAKLQKKNNDLTANISSLEKLVDLSRSQPMLNVAARFELGLSYQANNRVEDALKVFSALSEDKSNPLKLEAIFQKALAYEQIKQFDKAQAEYEKIIADAKSQESIVKKKSEDRLLELRLQG